MVLLNIGIGVLMIYLIYMYGYIFEVFKMGFFFVNEIGFFILNNDI